MLSTYVATRGSMEFERILWNMGRPSLLPKHSTLPRSSASALPLLYLLSLEHITVKEERLVSHTPDTELTPDVSTAGLDTGQPDSAEFSENVKVLKSGNKTFYIVGTAHVSQKSVEEVQAVIEQVKPDAVCVELCETRYKAITNADVWKKLDIFSVIKQGKVLYLLAHLALSSMQRRIGQKLGVKPGAEMIMAIEKAKEHNAELVLADREVQVTLRRTWRNLSFLDKVSVAWGLIGSLFGGEEITEKDIEKIKEKGELSNMMKQFAEALPSVKEPLIDERDSYLISSIEEAPGEKIVAVVGAGHVEGMTQKFGTTIHRDELNVIPPKGKLGGLLKWFVPLLVLAAFYVGYAKNADRNIWELVTMWVVPNAVMCALLTMLAGGKLLSAAVGFVASPITSLNPTIGAGMAVGLTEAWLRKPTVEDCERIPDDVKNFRGIYKNPFTRTLLVAFSSNVGSAVGAWVALLWLWLANFLA